MIQCTLCVISKILHFTIIFVDFPCFVQIKVYYLVQWAMQLFSKAPNPLCPTFPPLIYFWIHFLSSLLHHYYSPPPSLHLPHQYSHCLAKWWYPHSTSSSFSCEGACDGSGWQKEWQVRRMILHIVTDGWWYRMKRN